MHRLFKLIGLHYLRKAHLPQNLPKVGQTIPHPINAPQGDSVSPIPESIYGNFTIKCSTTISCKSVSNWFVTFNPRLIIIKQIFTNSIALFGFYVALPTNLVMFVAFTPSNKLGGRNPVMANCQGSIIPHRAAPYNVSP